MPAIKHRRDFGYSPYGKGLSMDEFRPAKGLGFVAGLYPDVCGLEIYIYIRPSLSKDGEFPFDSKSHGYTCSIDSITAISAGALPRWKIVQWGFLLEVTRRTFSPALISTILTNTDPIFVCNTTLPRRLLCLTQTGSLRLPKLDISTGGPNLHSLFLNISRSLLIQQN